MCECMPASWPLPLSQLPGLAPAQMLPDGPYLSELRHVHLGNNHLEAFPSALLRASKVAMLLPCWKSGVPAS